MSDPEQIDTVQKAVPEDQIDRLRERMGWLDALRDGMAGCFPQTVKESP